MSLLQKLLFICVIALSYNHMVLAANKRIDKSGTKTSPTNPSKIAVRKNVNTDRNDWEPITYRTETEHDNGDNSGELKMKDISDKSTQFFHDLTGTKSPYDKDMKTLANRGLKLIKEQENEEKYKNLKALESNNNGAAVSFRLPNNNFNKPLSYGFVIPQDERVDEQEREQATHHNNFHEHPHSHHLHSLHHHENPHLKHHQHLHHNHQSNDHHHHQTSEEQNPHHHYHHQAQHQYHVLHEQNLPSNQQNQQYANQQPNDGEYYPKPNQFAPHFEALTQARDITNYPDQNQNHNQISQPPNPALSYDVGIRHTFQDQPQQHFSAPIQNPNENANSFNPANNHNSQVHIQKFPDTPSESYNYQQLYFNDGIENSPHFEALTAEKQPIQNHHHNHHRHHHQQHQKPQAKKNKKNDNHHHYGSSYSQEHSCETDKKNGCDDPKETEYKSSSIPMKVSKNRKPNKHNAHKTPNKSMLLNHKIYHDDFENSSNSKSSENSSDQQTYQRKPSNTNKGKKTKKTKKPKRHNRPNHTKKQGTNNPSTPRANSENSKEQQYQYSKHPNNGQSYMVIEYPQESRISEKVLEPLPRNSTNPSIFDNEKTKLFRKKLRTKFENEHVDKDLKSSNVKFNETSSGEKNKSQLKKAENNSNININEAIGLPNPEYKFLINYRDENDRIDASDALKKPFTKEIRYFQDIYVAKPEPRYMEIGHKIERPDGHQEERFEENDEKNNRFRGSVKWVNGEGEQGQQLWDLGHLG